MAPTLASKSLFGISLSNLLSVVGSAGGFVGGVIGGGIINFIATDSGLQKEKIPLWLAGVLRLFLKF